MRLFFHEQLPAKRRVGMINIHGIYGISFPDLETWGGNHLLPSAQAGQTINLLYEQDVAGMCIGQQPERDDVAKPRSHSRRSRRRYPCRRSRCLMAARQTFACPE